jgi:hypothetical protein
MEEVKTKSKGKVTRPVKDVVKTDTVETPKAPAIEPIAPEVPKVPEPPVEDVVKTDKAAEKKAEAERQFIADCQLLAKLRFALRNGETEYKGKPLDKAIAELQEKLTTKKGDK